MKRLIALIFCASLLWTGCSKSPAPKGPEQFDRYIFFSQQVESKASLINSATDLAGKTFGVLGYRYDATTNWGNYSNTTPAPTPNVFYDGSGNPVTLETLTCDASASSSYAPLQGWYSNQKYTFFACYPMPAENSAVTLVNTSGGAYTGGAPAIKYDNLTHEKAKMVDVMTASIIGAYWKSSDNSDPNNPGYNGTSSTGELTVSFNHCLSCLGVTLKHSTAAGITIGSLSLTVSGLQYGSTVIPFTGTATSSAPTTTSVTSAITLTDTEKSLPTTAKEVADKLIFIPQTQKATIAVKVNYTRHAPKDSGYSDVTLEQTVATLTTTLTKGNKHLINLNFTESNVSATVTSGTWTTHTVDNTFN